MTPQEKIEYVRKLIDDKAQISPKGVIYIRLYTATEYEEGPVLIYRSEQKSIIQKLEEEGYIKNATFDEDGTGVWLEIISEKQEESPEPPIIRTQTLELISQHFADLGSLSKLSNYLLEWGVPRRLITLGTKWRMVYAVLLHYANPKTQNGFEMLDKIIGNILHPLMYGGDKNASEEAQDKFNKYLEYDGFTVVSDGKDEYSVRETKDLIEVDENELLQEFHEDLFIQEQEELAGMRLPENKEKISTLRKAYQVLMNITEVFCENPSKPSNELNDAYVKIKKLTNDSVRDLHLRVDSVNGVPRMHKLTHYFIPFNNLFSAEKEYARDDWRIDPADRKELSWNYIRPQMHATYGEIDDLYRKVEGSEILSKPNVQQSLNDVSLLLTKTKKEENRKQKEPKQKATPQLPIQRIEIAKMPELQIRNVEDNTISKGKKRIHLPKFSATDWGKVVWRFLDERNVLIGTKDDMKPSDFQALGFENETSGKPDKIWSWFFDLSARGGETETLSKPIPDTIKQKKLKIATLLKKLFKNDTDPFYDPTETQTYRLKIELIAPQFDEEPKTYSPMEMLGDL